MASTRAISGVSATLLCLAFGLLPAGSLTAQAVPTLPAPGEEVYEIRLQDGSTLFARITSAEGEAVVLTTTGGIRVEIERSQIAGLQLAEGQVVGREFWQADPNDSRLFFSATGRSLEQGRAYFVPYLIVLPFVAVGITDWLMVAGGAPLLFGQLEPLYVAPKIQLIRTDRVAVAVGALHILLSDDFNDTDVGFAYSVGTFGSRDNSLTVGIGFGYAGDEFASQPVATIGGELRTSRRVKLLTENLFLPGETGAVLSGGFRFIGERFSSDVGVGGAAGGGGGFCCVPLVNVSYVFGGP